MKMIFAIDFDGTLVENHPTTFEIVAPKMEVIETVKKVKEAGHIIILWTCRLGDRLEEAINFCKKYGLEFDYHNENSLAAKEHPFGDTRKIYADFYLDNKALTTWESLKAIAIK